jgi:hypothetical protein
VKVISDSQTPNTGKDWCEFPFAKHGSYPDFFLARLAAGTVTAHISTINYIARIP